MVVKEEQLNIKISEDDKKSLERGSELNNETLSSFVRRAALKKANQLIGGSS